MKIYQRRLDDLDFRGYNPFGMVNVMQDRVYLMPKPQELKQHLLRRGMMFVDGRRLEQVDHPVLNAAQPLLSLRFVCEWLLADALKEGLEESLL